MCIRDSCTRCHSERQRRGDLVLEGFDVAEAAQNGDVVEKMIRKLRAGMMPPSGARKPDPAVLADVATDLETTLDKAAERNPNPGTRTFQRLNRAEYHNTIKELFGIEVDVSTFLPLDTKSANFDNIADVQTPSATLMEGYLRAAEHVSRTVLGDPNAEIQNTVYRLSLIHISEPTRPY